MRPRDTNLLLIPSGSAFECAMRERCSLLKFAAAGDLAVLAVQSASRITPHDADDKDQCLSVSDETNFSFRLF